MFQWGASIIVRLATACTCSISDRHRSWKATYTALSQLEKPLEDPYLLKHLTNPHAFQILSSPFASFEPPSPQTKSSFETRTSAINVSPSPHGRYDIKQIREDSLWLSKETNIDEVAALRIAVLEWQSRPALKLLQDDISENTVSFRSTVGGINLQSLKGSQSLNRPPGATQVVGEPDSSADSKARRVLLLKTYLSERRYIIKASEHVTFAALVAGVKDKAPESSASLENLGNGILSVWNIQEQSQNTKKNFFIESVEALKSRLHGLEKASGWFEDDFQEDLELAWARDQLLEVLHILQIMLMLLESMSDLTRSDAFLAWFRFMGSVAFFETFEPVSLCADFSKTRKLI